VRVRVCFQKLAGFMRVCRVSNKQKQSDTVLLYNRI
jgi:hypothetical protein